MPSQRRHWLSISFLTAILLVLAALRPLAIPDEGRYGEIGRWMLVSGDWLVPRENGIPFFHKPPLLYWLEALSVWVFGANEWGLRLVVALHAAMMLAVSYLDIRRIATGQVAHTAVWMLGSSLAFLVGGQYINHDMMVAAWISVALWSFGLAFMLYDRPHLWLARGGFAACALAVLAKGLIGLALPGLVLLIWLVATRQTRKLLYLPWISGLLLFCAIALPWFVLTHLQFDQMLHYFFVKQHFQRYTESTFNNIQPFWFYGAALVLLFFPWIGFVVYQAAISISRPPSHGQVQVQVPALLRQAVVLWWVWLATIFIFFSIPSSKLLGYVLPVMPAVAALAALGWNTAMAGVKQRGRWFAIICGINLLAAAGANTAAARYSLKQSARDIARQFACQAGPGDTVYAVGGYPHDFPFYAGTTSPMVVVQDWAAARQKGGDNWRTELYEGADFDSRAARTLQPPEVLAKAAVVANNWVVAPVDFKVDGFLLVSRGHAWNLYRSSARLDPGLLSKGPITTNQKGLPGCN